MRFPRRPRQNNGFGRKQRRGREKNVTDPRNQQVRVNWFSHVIITTVCSPSPFGVIVGRPLTGSPPLYTTQPPTEGFAVTTRRFVPRPRETAINVRRLIFRFHRSRRSTIDCSRRYGFFSGFRVISLLNVMNVDGAVDFYS